MQLLAHDLADAYHQSHRYVTIDFLGGNSRSGLAEYARGSLDIAMVSRGPRSDELRQPPSRAVEIARDGIAIVVHPSNPIQNVSREQLAKIFSGEFSNWSDLASGPVPAGDGSIQVISREQGSGTREVFEQTIMAGRRVTLTAIVQPSSEDVLGYVESNPNAVGYVAFNIWNGNSTTRALSIDNVSASIEKIQSSTYPLMQTYYFVLPLKAGKDVEDFVDFVLAPDTRETITPRAASP